MVNHGLSVRPNTCLINGVPVCRYINVPYVVCVCVGYCSVYVLTTRLFRKALQTHTHTHVYVCVLLCVCLSTLMKLLFLPYCIN